MIVLLTSGFMSAWHARQSPPPVRPVVDGDFGAPAPFVPQKTRAVRRLKVLLLVGAGLAVVAAGVAIALVWPA